MAKYTQRGLTATQEQDHSRAIRDTRTIGMRISAALQNPHATAIVVVLFGMFAFMLPGFADLWFIVALCVFLFCITRRAKLPFRMPQHSGVDDYNDIKPGSNKPNKASGIYLYGYENQTGDELWFSNDDMRTHTLIFGSTGSGKTEALVSIAFNALCQSSGFIYVDGKGDNSLFAKVFSMVRFMGREDDMLLINFMTGARDIMGPQEKRLSNTMNPFSMGSSSMLSQLVVSLMGGASKSSDGDMWKGRAIGFVEALMKVLVVMRDAGYILLDASTIRDYFLLPKLEALVIDKLFIREDKDAVSLENFPKDVLEPIKNYVLNLPGYNPEKKGKQVSQVLEQHGYITMQLTRVFTSLADTYGHIMRTNLAEVDIKDVVLNRRILCVLLPALEKSPDELSNLGKIIVASLRSMMAAGLGDSVEGTFDDLVTRKPTNAPTPYLCILDEYGYYAVEGFAVVPAQARSLGFSIVFAGQDLPAFQKASKEEAASIGANTNIKVCMKLEDPIETWDFFNKGAGESFVTQVDSYQVNSGNLMGNYEDGKGARLEKRSRIDLLDLKEQTPGEAHFFFKSKIVRGRFFYSNPKPVKEIRLNHSLKIEKPEDALITALQKGLQQMDRLKKAPETIFTEAAPLATDLHDAIEKSLAVKHDSVFEIMACLSQEPKKEMGLPDDFFANMGSMDEPDPKDVNHVDLFMPLRITSYIEEVAQVSDLVEFARPLIRRRQLNDQFEYLGRLQGQNTEQAQRLAAELINDMASGSAYPPEMSVMPSGSGLAQAVEKIIQQLEAVPAVATDEE